MAALLRSGKLLRLVTGIARQSQTPSGPTQANQSNRNPSDTSLQGPTESNFFNPSWSLRHLSAALPALGSASQDVLEEDGPLKLTDLDLEAKVLRELEESKPKNDDQRLKKQKSITLKKALNSGVKGFDAIKEEEPPIDESKVAQKAVVSSLLDKSKGSSKTSKSKGQSKSLQEKSTVEKEAVAPDETPKRQKFEGPVHGVTVDPVTNFHHAAPVEVSPTPNQECILPPSVVTPLIQVQESGVSKLLPLHSVCALFRDQGRITDLENLLIGSYGIQAEDRKMVFMWMLQAYADQGMLNGAIMLRKRLEWEGLSQDFPEFHLLLTQLIQSTTLIYQPSPELLVSSPSIPYQAFQSSPSVASNDDGSYVQSLWSRKLKKAIQREQPSEAMRALSELGKINKVVSVNELSAVVELLVKNEQFSEAVYVTEAMLKCGTYPTPKIFRFLLNRLATTGQVESMQKLNVLISSNARKEVSFDNRLCNAYLAAGRGREYLEDMERELDGLDPQNLEIELERLKDKFPRGGAMGILETDPSLVGSFTRVAEKFLKHGFVAPTNVLWTYHLINGNYDVAEALWNKHVKHCSQIMFQKVCQTARLTGNSDLAWRLVDLLRKANVTRGARGIAYSCLIDVLALKGDYEEGCEALRQAFADGVFLSDVNRTALKRLRDCCTQNGVIFSFQEPQTTNDFYVKMEDKFSSAMVAF